MTDDSESSGTTLEPRGSASVEPDGPLGELRDALAPARPDVVRDVRRNKAREALFGRPVARQLGRYVVLDELGRGGMGTVLTAYDPQLDRKVALKLLHDPNLERHAKRLEREAKALAKLSHPNVVQVYEVGVEDEQRFVAMELVHGQTLRQWQAERRPWKACVEVYLQAGRGLAAAHAKGLVHRDFKPGNCILDEDGRVRVLDFGLVHRSDDAPDSHDTTEGPREPLAGASSSGLTKTGAVLGTPAYMPPEQLAGRGTDARSDQFSFCVALYEALYGERPYDGDSVEALMSTVTTGTVRPPPEGTRVPPKLRRVLLRGLAAEPDDRWPSMEAVQAELQRLVAPRARRWALLSLTVGVLGVGGGLALGQVVDELERCTDAHRRLTNIWDDGRRREVKEAILGTGLSYAPDTWERVEQRLDDYADAWASKHTEVCEASTEDAQGEDDRRLRMDCMHERSRALRAAVDVLVRADTGVVENAMKLTVSLPGFERCDDLGALRAAMPPPEDPEVEQEVETVRERLADINAMQVAGNFGPATEETELLVERANALGYGPLEAEAELMRGSLQEHNGQFKEAEHDLREAFDLAMEHRHDEVAFRAALDLTFVVGVRQGRHAEGQLWGRIALAHAKRNGDDEARTASLAYLGNVELYGGNYEEARLHLEQAVRVGEATLGGAHPSVANCLGDLSVVLAHFGEYEQALDHLERARVILENELGSNHPHFAMLLDNMGNVLHEQGRYESAHDLHVRALQTLEETLGTEHPGVAVVLNNLGSTLVARGEHARAQPHFERALRIEENALGGDHPWVAFPLMGLADIALANGDMDTARLFADRAVSIRVKSGIASEHIAEAHFLLARALWPEPEQRHRARSLAEQARDAYAESGEAQTEELAEVEQWLAEHRLPFD